MAWQGWECPKCGTVYDMQTSQCACESGSGCSNCGHLKADHHHEGGWCYAEVVNQPDGPGIWRMVDMDPKSMSDGSGQQCRCKGYAHPSAQER